MPKQLFAEYPLAFYVSIVCLAFLLVRFAIPSIIHTANKYKLYDSVDLHRKEHTGNISRLGGIGLFCGFTITVLLFATTVNYQEANFLIASSILLFALGIKDDIYGVSPNTKFALQIVVALILVCLGDFKLSSLYGVFDIWNVHPFAGGIFSVALIIFINNAFNLIDGVDGLAGTVGVIVNLFFGMFFALEGNMPYAFIAFSMLGAILGFLVFNYPPAKIFMGDTGSLIIGLVSAVLAIKFIEINKVGFGSVPYFKSAPSIAVAVLIVPVFDSLRIFFIRIVNKKSPFRGDRNHIHHRLLRLGLSSKQVLLVTVSFNLSMIALTLMFSHLGNFGLIFLQIGICVVCNGVLTYIKGKKKAKSYTVKDVFIKDTVKLL
ncbi:MraY family glycosyltransferase [Pedobacter xixiisoli]|uniref:UDP-N-acetylmuramyl pentapeptide phosphotransferase/UDP-N-acetylglucosamine-1-phosphate transferase n=1 Tax=Pedobacter xixiisoli TaxID=1476464 RepID=A0A286A9T8_9SPHI|nr:MraY family glycosyltransferase [Pedobacter xixiisoli]SOD18680.1 UDP-N-acetylmuramyl pentapeptide phosphotransferase/UDP-N-acetylglucosamine-1-phosphate transferase [Pedobacter xixiisoli]